MDGENKLVFDKQHDWIFDFIVSCQDCEEHAAHRGFVNDHGF